MLWGGRRAHARRTGDSREAFVDRHGVGLLAVTLTIILLNVLDAHFTLLFLAHGGQELNPVVQLLLDWSIPAFLLLKSLGIGVCVGFLVITKNFRAARIGLTAVLTGYTLLLGWHLYLLLFVVGQ